MKQQKSTELEQLRVQIQKIQQTKTCRSYNALLKQQVCAFFSELTITQLHRSLEISKITLLRWKRESGLSPCLKKGRRGFLKIVIESKRPFEQSSEKVELIFPNGVKVYGITKEDLFSWVVRGDFYAQ